MARFLLVFLAAFAALPVASAGAVAIEAAGEYDICPGSGTVCIPWECDIYVPPLDLSVCHPGVPGIGGAAVQAV